MSAIANTVGLSVAGGMLGAAVGTAIGAVACEAMDHCAEKYGAVYLIEEQLKPSPREQRLGIGTIQTIVVHRRMWSMVLAATAATAGAISAYTLTSKDASLASKVIVGITGGVAGACTLGATIVPQIYNSPAKASGRCVPYNDLPLATKVVHQIGHVMRDVQQGFDAPIRNLGLFTAVCLPVAGVPIIHL